ncbi:MAG: type II secretion system protein [Phycisphaerales bacterium]|jgi:type II secretory pathway pseudopilin PulG|nr:type II secretion system protein [Phycisphaerales bacterium]
MSYTGSVRSAGRRGFTLVETGLAIVIVATGMLAMLAAHEAFVQQNDWGERAAQAARLGGEIRERSMVLAVDDPVTGGAFWGAEAGEVSVADWDDMDDFDGLDVSGWAGDGPIDASGSVIPGMQGWRQVVDVQSVDPTDLSTPVADGTSEAVRVSVDVYWQDNAGDPGDLVTTVTWVHVQ